MDHRDYHYVWRNTLTYSPLAAFPEIRRAGANISHYVRPGMFLIDSSATPTINQYLEVGENSPDTEQEMPFSALQTYPVEVTWIWDVESVSGFGTGSWSAVQLGCAGVVMPYPAAPVRPIAQLRWTPENHSLSLYVARGDGSTPATSIAIAAPPYAGARFRLVSIPNVRVEAWLDYEKVAELTTPALLPDWPRLYSGIPGMCRLGLSQWTGPGFLGTPSGLKSWIAPPTLYIDEI